MLTIFNALDPEATSFSTLKKLIMNSKAMDDVLESYDIIKWFTPFILTFINQVHLGPHKIGSLKINQEYNQLKLRTPCAQ